MKTTSLSQSCWHCFGRRRTAQPVARHVSGGGQHAEFAMASGEMSEAEFIRFDVACLANMAAHLKDGGIAMAFMDHHHPFELMPAARKVGFKHLNLCVWAKTNGGMGSLYRTSMSW